MRLTSILFALPLGLVLSSCSSERTYHKSDSLPTGFSSDGTGDAALSDVASIDTSIHASLGGGGTKLHQTKQMSASSVEEMMEKYPIPDDLVMTDADNPDAHIQELEDAFNMATQMKKSWQQSYGSALKQARREGKPILIWFHDSEFSPTSKSLEQEVFNLAAFDAWADQNIVRLKYDKSEKFPGMGNGENESTASDKSNYVKRVFSHFSVRSTPVIIILHSDGQQITKLSGYKSGNSNDMLRQISHNVSIGVKQHQELRSKLSKEGYRSWTGRNKAQVFAKPAKYDQKTQTLWLKEFDGRISKTKLNQLSSADQEWVSDNL